MGEKYKKTKENYDKGIDWHIQKSLSYSWVTQIDRFVKKLKGNRVLDAGCGGGRDIKEFIKRGIKVDGIDYSRETIKRCRKVFPQVKFYVGDLRKMNLPNREYDGVWACASILNLKKKDIPKALSEFKRVLKKGGKLFVSVKGGKGERLIRDQAGERFFSFFSSGEIKGLLEKSGFKVAYLEIISDAKLKMFDPLKPNWICLYAESS
ncbi:MAG TPA: class I SAM-dependent methyltransferase [Candidatus Nanoarchaeia archaeon]|nr:class I SAM-dependent methyltransferase [Candidatus Nanoarchaeia archaeon]